MFKTLFLYFIQTTWMFYNFYLQLIVAFNFLTRFFYFDISKVFISLIDTNHLALLDYENHSGELSIEPGAYAFPSEISTLRYDRECKKIRSLKNWMDMVAML